MTEINVINENKQEEKEKELQKKEDALREQKKAMDELKNEMIMAKNELDSTKRYYEREILNLNTDKGMPVKEVIMKAVKALTKNERFGRVMDDVYRYLDGVNFLGEKQIDVLVGRMFGSKDEVARDQYWSSMSKFDRLFENEDSISNDFER